MCANLKGSTASTSCAEDLEVQKGAGRKQRLIPASCQSALASDVPPYQCTGVRLVVVREGSVQKMEMEDYAVPLLGANESQKQGSPTTVTAYHCKEEKSGEMQKREGKRRDWRMYRASTNSHHLIEKGGRMAKAFFPRLARLSTTQGKVLFRLCGSVAVESCYRDVSQDLAG
eukprot:gene1674-1039_t